MSWIFYTLTNTLSATAAEDGLHDIKGPARIGLPIREILVVAGCVAAAILLLWLAFGWYKKRKDRPAPLERVLTPEERALARLNDPALSDALKTGDFKYFYFGISDAIREYIAGRYTIDAMDLTTDELLLKLGSKSDSAVIFSAAHTFLGSCDLVKFAKLRPSVEEAKESLERAFNIVTVCEEFFQKKAVAEEARIREARRA